LLAGEEFVPNVYRDPAALEIHHAAHQESQMIRKIDSPLLPVIADNCSHSATLHC